MANFALQSTVLQSAGGVRVAPLAQVTIRTDDVEQDLVDVWLDKAGASSAGNPFSADEDGHFLVYLGAGEYRITVAAGGHEQVLRHWLVGNEGGEVDVSDRALWQPTNDALGAVAGEDDGQAAVTSRALSGRLGGGLWFWDEGALETADGIGVVGAPPMSGRWKRTDLVSQDMELRLPTDFGNVQDALDVFSAVRCTPRARILLRAEAGHELTRGWRIIHGSYSRFVLVADDETLGVSDGFVGVSNAGLAESAEEFISEHNLVFGFCAEMPVLGCKIDMGRAPGNGVHVIECTQDVRAGCGVIYAGMNGFYPQVSRTYALGSIWDRAGFSGCRVQQATGGTLQKAEAKYCCELMPSGFDNGAVFVSRGSKIQMRHINASFSYQAGIEVHRADVYAQDAILTDCAGHAVQTMLGGYVLLEGADMRRSGRNALRTAASVVFMANADLSGSASIPVYMAKANMIDANGATTRASQPGVPHIDDFGGDGGGPRQFNTPMRRGIVFSDLGSGREPWQDVGFYSASGQTSGKRFGDAGVLLSSRDNTGGRVHMELHNPNGEVGRLVTSGNGASLESVSDGRMKSNRAPVDPEAALARLRALGPVDFDWPSGERGRGLIAQDVARVYPGAATAPEAEDGRWTMNYSDPGLIADIVAAINGLSGR